MLPRLVGEDGVTAAALDEALLQALCESQRQPAALDAGQVAAEEGVDSGDFEGDG